MPELSRQSRRSQPEPHSCWGRRFAASDGCNRLTASYELKGETITFSKIAGTMMACPDTAGTERAFKQALPNTRRWRITGDALELYDADGTRLARFDARDKP